jgi:hypothetical protein
MAKKKIIIELEFDEVTEYEYTALNLTSITRTHSDLDADELNALGESVAQSDYWQVDRWLDIQRIIGGEVESVKLPLR